MAIVQISQIQLRRGLQQDLPQLASAEMGWSLDTRRLFIGNGTLAEGAPNTGVTEILTEYSNFLGFISSYTFAGTDAGFTSQTGSNSLTPVTRSLQSVLDETVSIRDFGAKGDGSTDDTAAINRALQQIYPSTLNGTYPNVRRTIHVPAGNYKITGTINIPPNCKLVGDGKNNTIISATTGTVFTTVDSLFQSGASIGNNGAQLPGYVFIDGMTVSSAAGGSPVVLIDSANDVVFKNVIFTGINAMTYVVAGASSIATTKALTFENCIFNNGASGFGAIGFISVARIKDSTFNNCTSYGINISSYVSGLVSQNNFFNGIATPVYGMTGNNYSFGDTVTTSDHGGLYSGSAKYGIGQTVTLSTGTTVLKTLGNGAGTIDYQIQDNSNNYRFGTMKYSKSNGVCTFEDEYVEPTVSLGANVYANSTGALSCTVSNSSTFKFNIKQFIV